MKKQLLLLAMILLPMLTSAHDIEVKNADGVTIYYNYINNATELEVTFRGDNYISYQNEYQGNVVIPEEVTYMFITFKVTSIGENAFREGHKQTSVIIPNSVTSIGAYAFYKCLVLTSVTIGNSVTSIGDYAFYKCDRLTSVTIGNSVSSIGPKAFYGCSGLTSVTIPNSVTTIDYGAFQYCSGLTSIIIPNSVTSIGKIAFYGCRGLTSVTIPNSVTSIGNQAFAGWDLSVVISLIDNPFAIEGKAWDDRTFSLNTFENATLYVPKGTIETYKATEGWMDFANIKEGNPTGINVVENIEDNKAVFYNLNCVRLSEPQKGINIIKGKKYVKK